MNDLKESILNDAEKGGGDPTNTSNQTTSHTTNASNFFFFIVSIENTGPSTTTTTRTNDTYVYGVDILAVLAIGVCVFFVYNTSQSENKKLVNKKQDQPPKRRHML